MWEDICLGSLNGQPRGRDAQGRSDARGLKLAGSIAVVAGATRGAGRGIARALAEAGAKVYCTGRSLRGNPSPYNRPEKRQPK